MTAVRYPPPARLSIDDRTFVVAVKPELTVADFVPWCVEVDGGWYRVAPYDSTDPDVPREARRFLTLKLRSESSRRGPAWLADYETPLMLRIAGQVVIARASKVDEERWPVWILEHQGRTGEGGEIKPDQGVEAVENLAGLWLLG